MRQIPNGPRIAIVRKDPVTSSTTRKPPVKRSRNCASTGLRYTSIPPVTSVRQQDYGNNGYGQQGYGSHGLVQHGYANQHHVPQSYQQQGQPQFCQNGQLPQYPGLLEIFN